MRPTGEAARARKTGGSDPKEYKKKEYKPWRPRHREHAGAPDTTADLMGQVLARLGGQGRALEFRVFDCYGRAIGDLLRARTAPDRLTGTTLFVRVASSALAHEVSVLKGEILQKMAVDLGPGVVADLRTRVGRVET